MTEGQENHHYRGQVVINGVYQWTGLSVNDPLCIASDICQYLADTLHAVGTQVFGWTFKVDPSSNSYYLSQTFFGTIDNVWSANGNSIPENAGTASKYWHRFLTTGADSVRDVLYDAAFPISTSTSMINPFDLVSNVRSAGSHSNNAPRNDGEVMTLTRDEFARRNTLHELGHALGIIKHPGSGRSVMRSGIGPAKAKNFSTLDKSGLNLGW